MGWCGSRISGFRARFGHGLIEVESAVWRFREPEPRLSREDLTASVAYGTLRQAAIDDRSRATPNRLRRPHSHPTTGFSPSEAAMARSAYGPLRIGSAYTESPASTRSPLSPGRRIPQPSPRRDGTKRFGSGELTAMKLLIILITLLALLGGKPQDAAPPVISEPLRTFEGHTAPVLSVIFSHDGKTLVAGSINNLVKIWKVE